VTLGCIPTELRARVPGTVIVIVVINCDPPTEKPLANANHLTATEALNGLAFEGLQGELRGSRAT
jgi:hypothetical protein